VDQIDPVDQSKAPGDQIRDLDCRIFVSKRSTIAEHLLAQASVFPLHGFHSGVEFHFKKWCTSSGVISGWQIRAVLKWAMVRKNGAFVELVDLIRFLRAVGITPPSRTL